MIIGLLIETTIDRTEFGIGTDDWAATMVVGDEVRIRILIELKKKYKQPFISHRDFWVKV
jgi:hypothetical protein